jgi:hypothetical protein
MFEWHNAHNFQCHPNVIYTSCDLLNMDVEECIMNIMFDGCDTSNFVCDVIFYDDKIQQYS